MKKNMKIPKHILPLIALCSLALPQARAADGTWNVDNDGNWGLSTNWNPGAVPGGVGSTVNLTYNFSGAANRTITINAAPVTVGILNMSDGTGAATNRIALAASVGNYLTMDNGASEAQINLGAPGSNQVANANLITAPVRMTANGLVVRMYGSNINLGGNITSTTTGTTVLRVATGSGNPQFSGTISDGGVGKVVAFLNDSTATTNLTKANTFSGGVTIQLGSVTGGNEASFGTGTITLGTDKSTGVVTLSNAGTRTYANNILVSAAGTSATAKISTQTANSNITYTGNIEMQRALTVNSEHEDGLTTFSGTISGAGNLNVVNGSAKISKGVILSGSNTYSGTTAITVGTLLINGDNSAATGAVTATGATAILGGTGTIGGAVTVSAAATLAVGGTNTGILTTTKSVTLADTGIFSAQINGATAGTGYDRLVVNGSSSVFSLTGTNDLKLTLGYTAEANALFFLVDNNGSSAISGIFEKLNSINTDLSQGALFTVAGQDFRISYTGNRAGNTFLGGNDLVIQAVPEPTTGLLLVAGPTALAALSALRRRRK